MAQVSMASEKGFQGDLSPGPRSFKGRRRTNMAFCTGLLGNMAQLGLPLRGQQKPSRILTL